MLRALLSCLLVFAAGCRATIPGGEDSADAWRSELAGRTPGPARPCISDFPGQSLRAVDSATVAFGFGRTIWVNRLAAACPSLSPYNVLIVERSGGQICRGDRIRGLEPGSTIAGPSCNLQDWVPYRRP